MPEMHRILFVVGDWSTDGHGRTESFVMESSAPLRRLHELYFRAKDRLGIDPESFCCEYEDSRLPEDVYGKIIGNFGPKLDAFFDEWDGERSVEARFFPELVSLMISSQDPKVTVRVLPEEQLPHFIGGGKKHIGQMGYGLFCG